MTSLFDPVKIGAYTAKNRMFMAPMSRYRAPDFGKVPEMTVDYYRQRASSGLIIAESTRVNDWSGAMNCPGIHSEDQVAAWKQVTDAVHAEDGLIFLQLWHSGRAAHATHLPQGRVVVAPSAIPNTTNVMTANGLELPTPPKALTLDEIAELRSDFAKASRNALEAGFDGVELHAAGGFLIDTFLQEPTNQRTDQYGGSNENRFRFLREVLEDAIQIWGADRVAVKLSPTSSYNDMGKGDVKGTFSYVISELDKYGLAFLEVNEQLPFGEGTAENAAIIAELRKMWTGTYVANGNATFESGTARVADETATAISYGRPYIANPDLPQRFQQGAALAEPNMETFYGGDETGYTDYPALQQA
ncbi:alkene reductase [Paracoccus homiensis]|uniref:alkene reductase n=1 Tax=Paracoccus homiensis TaxID=364199 RepID=UPI00398CB31E